MTPPKSILRKSTDMPKTIQRVKLKKAIARHTKIRDQNPSLGYICPGGEPHERSPNAPKFEDRSLEETEWQEQGARDAAWKQAKNVLTLKEHERASFFSSSENRCLQCSRRDNCSFRHDINKRGKMTQMSRSVQKLHHQIRLRILSCSRMSENHREPGVSEEKVRVVECRDGLARITSKELAITHPAKDGILLNACTTRPRVVVGFWRSAHSHTVRLMNSRLKRSKKE